MKNLANLLRKSDISPRERVITIVSNDMYRDRNGKNILSESEIYSLTQGWKPKNTHEVNEYNKYLELSRIEQTMRLDSYSLGLRSENSLLRSIMLIEHSSYEVNKQSESIATSKYVSKEDIVDFIVKNTYVEYDKLIHLITLNNISKETKEDLIILDEYVDCDKKYLEDEVFLYERFKKSKTLSFEDKNFLIDRIFSCIYHEGLQKIRGGSEKDGFLTAHFFAELPVEAILNKWVEYSLINIPDKDSNNILDYLEKYSNEKGKTMEIIIKETLSKWIDDGLFILEYTPLFLSDGFETWNGNTKKKHKDIFDEWYKEIQKTKDFINQNILNGSIKSESIDRNFYNTSSITKVITGQSMYTCLLDENFVIEYKKQIEILIPITYTFLLIKKYCNPLENLVTLKSFLELSDLFSEIFEIDMRNKYEKNLDSFKYELLVLNQTIGKQLEKVNESIHSENKLFSILEINEDEFFFKEENSSLIKPDTIIDDYKKHINKAGFLVK